MSEIRDARLQKVNALINKWFEPYAESFDNSLPLEGAGQAKEHFAIVFTPYLTTQKFSNYIHNMKDRIDKDYLCTF